MLVRQSLLGPAKKHPSGEVLFLPKRVLFIYSGVCLPDDEAGKVRNLDDEEAKKLTGQNDLDVAERNILKDAPPVVVL